MSDPTSEPRTCSQCNELLAEDITGEICPKCLVLKGFDTGNEPYDSSATTEPLPTLKPESFRAERLTELFPELEIQSQLGQGGMGVVYRAKQRQLDRLVALKILRVDTEADPTFAERFLREARAMAKLNHPAIITVFDFGQRDGLYYFLMELVDGPNLRRVVRAGELTPEQALVIVPQICDALQYAHDQNVVHRDVKPENILLTSQGHVKIADFGLAKLMGTEESDYTLTGTRQVMGTPHYMAPEQMEQPQLVDHRADIFSLGVVFYEMLTGELPLGRFAPPSEKVSVDVRLDEVVLRTLAKEPELRYQHATDIKTEVESVSGSSNAKARAFAAANGLHTIRKAPAIGLMVSGIITTALCAIFFMVGAFTSEEEALGGSLVTLPGPFILYGAVSMYRRKSWAWAVTACVAAMIPPTFGCVIGLPFAIWGLIVLLKPETQATFESVITKAETSAAISSKVSQYESFIDNATEKASAAASVAKDATIETIRKTPSIWARFKRLVGKVTRWIPRLTWKKSDEASSPSPAATPPTASVDSAAEGS